MTEQSNLRNDPPLIDSDASDSQPFIMIYEHVYMDPTVSGMAMKLYAVLLSYCRKHQHTVGPFVHDLAEQLGVTSATVHKYLNELEHDHRLVTRYETRRYDGSRGRNHYRVWQEKRQPDDWAAPVNEPVDQAINDRSQGPTNDHLQGPTNDHLEHKEVDVVDAVDEASAHKQPTLSHTIPEGADSNNGSDLADDDDRPEVTSLLDVLAAEIDKNGLTAPRSTKKNRNAARLLIDRDGWSPQQIEWLIRWCQGHEFWHTNILSMSKFRAQFDQMRAQALADWRKTNGQQRQRTASVTESKMRTRYSKPEGEPTFGHL